MTAIRLAKGLFAFQIPVILIFLGGVGITGIRDVNFLLVLLVPASAALLIGSLITWGLEALRPLPPERRAGRMARYQLPTLIITSLPIAAYGFLAGAMMGSHFDWGGALLAAGALFAGYAVVVAAPLALLAHLGAVTPPPRPRA